MDIKRRTDSNSCRGNGLSVSYLRLLAPPLQLYSAALWQVVQQGLVDHYGMLEEFVTMVTELVPEMMSYRQRAELILGLRARLVLELCRGEHPADLQSIQTHLDRIKAPVSTAKDHHVTIHQVEESEVNFVELVHTLLENHSEREHFFEEIFPVHFGSKYDTALEMLVWEFISRLEELLPVPDFTQMAAWLGESPSFLEECLQSFSPPQDMKAILVHHRSLGHVEDKDPGLLPMGDCILSSLSVLALTRRDTASTPCLSSPENSPLPGNQDQPSFPNGQAQPGRNRGATKKGAQGSNPTRRHRDRSPPAEPATNENQSWRGGRALRKRKLSGGAAGLSKQPTEALPSLDSALVVENSESPLISIWGEYTESQETAFTPVSDTKVPWSDDETLNLLDIWGKDSVQRGLKGCLKNRHIFTLIAEKMAERGYNRSVEQCQTRIKRLKKCYRQTLQKNKGNPSLECKYFDQLEQVLGSGSSSAVPEVTFDVEEVMEEEMEEDPGQDSGDDLQFIGHTSREEFGTRSVPWTDFETLALINIWGEEQMQQELKDNHRNGHIFALISTKLATQGFSRTTEQCQTRVKRLKASFRQCYENNMKGKEQVECKFYEQLGRILIQDVSPLAESGEGNKDSDLNLGQADTGAATRQWLEAAVGAQEERKKVPWSDKETLILLEIWGDHQTQQKLRRSSHNGHIFSEISEKLSISGYPRSADQCHTRIKRLKSTFRHCQENMSKTGNDRVDFKFYDLLEQIIDKQPSTSSALATESIEISDDSSDDSANDTEADVSPPSEKMPSGIWSDEEVLALVDVWGEDEVQRELRGLVHNGHVYANISEKMHDLGYSKTPEQCRWKVKSLRKNFRQCYDRKKLGRNKVEYKFYKQLEGILGQEAVSLDEYDGQDEQADPDSGMGGIRSWSEQETVALIQLWADDGVQHHLKTSVRNGHIYAELADKMAAVGYVRTAEQCQSRIIRLRKTYKRFCDSRRIGGQPMLFRYYQLLEPVLGDEVVYDVDSSVGDSATQPLLDTEDDLYEQASSSHHHLAESSRKMPWSDRETRTLLEIWGEDGVQATLRGRVKNRHIYDYISQKMREHGFIRTTEQCYTRVKRLKAGFLHDREEFRFFNEMEQILGRELKDDRAVAESQVAEMPSESTPESDQMKDNHWVAEGSKLAWSDSETELLLDIWGSEDIQEDLKGCAKNKHIFARISRALASQGFLRTAEQCQTRIKRLRAGFRHFIEGSKGEKQECKYFNQLLRIFGSQFVTTDFLADEPGALISTPELDISHSP